MRVGILGGGQLGRMLALAGYRIGVRCSLVDASPEAPARDVAPLAVAGAGDLEALGRLAASADVVTAEIETVSAADLRWLEERVAVRPNPDAFEVAQDRLLEKRLFRELGIPTPAFAAVDSREQLEEALAEVGLPAVLKIRRHGYDGRGQRLARTPAEAHAAFAQLGGGDLLLEAFVPFTREVSLLLARGAGGESRRYPLVENRHEEGILRVSLAPAADPGGALERRASAYAEAVAERLAYVGVLALELFDSGDALLANEIAPRVHNSGHWTIEGARIDQFENHLRAVLGLPLGSTEPLGHAGMVNLIGALPDLPALLELDGARVHLYGKAPRPGRKLGHVTVVAESRDELAERIAAIEPAVRATGSRPVPTP